MTAAHDAARTRLIHVAVLFGALLVVAQSAADMVAVLAFHSYDSLVDLDRSNALPDVVSVAIILSAAAGSAVLSTRLRSSRWVAGVLTVVLVLIALDDAAHFSDDTSTMGGRVVILTVLCGALLTVAVALRTSRTPLVCMLLGIVLLAIDVKVPFLYDQLMNVTGNPWVQRGDLLYELGIVLDEAIEVTAWLLLSAGLWIAALEAGDTGTVRVEVPAG